VRDDRRRRAEHMPPNARGMNYYARIDDRQHVWRHAEAREKKYCFKLSSPERGRLRARIIYFRRYLTEPRFAMTKFPTEERERIVSSRATPWLLARHERTAINGSPVHCVALNADPRTARRREGAEGIKFSARSCPRGKEICFKWR